MKKNKNVALILCVLLGYFGAHRFYVGKFGTGILYIFTMGLFGVGWIVDIFLIATDKFIPKEQNANNSFFYNNNLNNPLPNSAITNVSTNSEPYVFVTAHGKKFHWNDDCSGISNPIKISLDKARAAGYKACNRCCYDYLHR